ncbi:hypothetical protein ACT3TE_18255 [Brachybacterium sp. AOP42-B2-9]|uniref:hypothetical protein n=1 Tax=Brachybacterium sp. AOP42-B2-9 TaxID=3457672 RepID=UPI004034E5F8
METMNPDLEYLLDELDESVKWTLATSVVVEEKGGTFTADQILSSSSNKWMKLPEVVAVAYDLVNSTQLGLGRHDTSSARIYQSGVEGAVRSLNAYGADFIDIQGDGGFGLFWGEKAYERALCSAITIKTFSLKFVERLTAKYGEELPDTGFKVGIHSARTLVKKIGTLRKKDEQEAVWAGKPVNYAYKCAQASEAHVLIVTDKVWQKFKNNDYVVYSCGCPDEDNRITEPTNVIWTEGANSKLPDDENIVHVLGSAWCVNHGAEFSEAIMSGKTNRDDISEHIRQEQVEKMAKALERKEAKERQARRDRVNRL